jgi:hypothetical protein
VKSFEETIKTQEKVISRMQSVLETQLANRANPASVSGSAATVSLSRSMPLKPAEGASTTSPATSSAAGESSVQVTGEIDVKSFFGAVIFKHVLFAACIQRRKC